MSALICVVAGLSSRMGAFKPLLPLGERSIIRTLIARYRSCGIDRIILVTGHNADLLEDHVRDLPVVCRRNERYAQSDMFESVKIGIRAYLEEAAADAAGEKVFITPGDIPLVSESTIESLIGVQSDACAPTMDGRRGHPLCLCRCVLEKIPACTAEGGLKGALDALGIEVEPLAVADPGILFDADTPEDYERLKRLFRELSE